MTEVLIQFDIPDEIMTLNKLPGTPNAARQHRARKNEWFNAAYYATVAAMPGGPSKRRMEPCDVYIMLPVWGERWRDPGNFTLTTKPIVDAMVEAGVWPDDNPEWVTEKAVTFNVIKNREEAMKGKVIIRLVER